MELTSPPKKLSSREPMSCPPASLPPRVPRRVGSGELLPPETAWPLASRLANCWMHRA